MKKSFRTYSLKVKELMLCIYSESKKISKLVKIILILLWLLVIETCILLLKHQITTLTKSESATIKRKLSGYSTGQQIIVYSVNTSTSIQKTQNSFII